MGLNGNERVGARSVWFGCHYFFFIFSGFPFMYPPSLFYILIFSSVSFLGPGLLMSPLVALSPMIWREHRCPYCCEKADRLQRGHRRTGGDVDPTCASGLAELGFLPFSLPFSFHVLPKNLRGRG